jgi:hypothetical protein
MDGMSVSKHHAQMFREGVAALTTSAAGKGLGIRRKMCVDAKGKSALEAMEKSVDQHGRKGWMARRKHDKDVF